MGSRTAIAGDARENGAIRGSGDAAPVCIATRMPAACMKEF
jgi:hypothetical protein